MNRTEIAGIPIIPLADFQWWCSLATGRAMLTPSDEGRQKVKPANPTDWESIWSQLGMIIAAVVAVISGARKFWKDKSSPQSITSPPEQVPGVELRAKLIDQREERLSTETLELIKMLQSQNTALVAQNGALRSSEEALRKEAYALREELLELRDRVNHLENKLGPNAPAR